MVENAEMNNVVYLYKCTECTVTIRGKINSVVIDACKKTAIVMDSVVAAVEFINCQSVQMQVFETFFCREMSIDVLLIHLSDVWKGPHDFS